MHLRVLLRTLFMVGVVESLALIAARHFSLYGPTVIAGATGLSMTEFLLFFGISTVVFLMFLKWYKGDLLYRILLYAVVAFGLVTIFDTIFPTWIIPIVVALFITAMIVTPYVWVYNLSIGLAAAGIGPLFGLQMDWQTGAAILLFLSVYDFIAVYGTRHMVTMAYRMLKSRAIFGIIIPEKANGYHSRMELVQPGAGFLVLGGGDLILPMLVTCSIYLTNPIAAYGGVIGILVGVIGNHILLTRYQKPIPALPLIALGTILGTMIGLRV